MSYDGVVRVRYFEGQFLRRQDFDTEQRYQIAMRRRHNVANHSWGIVEGLGLGLAAEGGGLEVDSGYAVDGYGRELVVTSRRPVPPEELDERRGDVFDVWLEYDKEAADPAPPGWACPGERGRDDYRWLEIPRVTVTPADPRNPPPARQPPGTEIHPWAGAAQTPPDDPAVRWPVFLGRAFVRPDDEDTPYFVDPSGRPFAGLVGNLFRRSDEVLDVSVSLDAATDGRGGRFAVNLPDGRGGEIARLTVDDPGGVTVRGDLTVEGDVTVAGAVDFEVGTAASPPESGAGGWQVYLADPGSAGRELRIQMPGLGSGAGSRDNRVVVGAWSEEAEAFLPALIVGADRTVRVPGELVVEGRLVKGQEGAPRAADTEDALLGNFLAGLELGGQLPEPLLRALAIQLAEDPEKLPEFLCLLKIAIEERGGVWPPSYIDDPCGEEESPPQYGPPWRGFEEG